MQYLDKRTIQLPAVDFLRARHFPTPRDPLDDISRQRLGRPVPARITECPGCRFVFKPVDDSLALAGGKLRLYSIDGLGGEGALMAYIEGDRFLWASDYIQTLERPSSYATDVWQAVERAGIRPSRVAAEHLPLTDWGVVDSLALSQTKKNTT